MDAVPAAQESSSKATASPTSPPSSLHPTSPRTPDAMFRPPVNRAMRVLDRSFFKTTVPLASAAVMEARNIGPVQARLMKSKDLLNVPSLWRVKPVAPVQVVRKEDEEVDRRRKCLLLRPEIKPDDTSTWPPTITQLVEEKLVDLRPYQLSLTYDDWGYSDIVSSILPEEMMNDIPVGYSQAGHLAHFNLRDRHLPYRYLIAEVLLDKINTLRTVINKIDDVGSENEFRTFPYELLGGDPNMNVVTTEQGCEFSFDYSKVYWNPRLQHEHQLVVDSFKEGQAVCDVMAGVGPFAMPAGKKRIFVLANDLNPYGYERMKYIIKRNKLWGFVEPHNMDGREFIKWATKSLYADPPRTASIPLKIPKSQQNKNLPTKGTKRRISTERLPTTLEYSSPPTFDHFIMNLPATAINFLDAFIGVYAGQEKLFQPRTDRKLPLIHVYCFAGNSEDQLAERIEICDRISERIDYKITPEDCATGSGNKAIELAIRDVRLVSPTKMMYCATFRLPAEVAFRKV